jgi:hypothetical protein
MDGDVIIPELIPSVPVEAEKTVETKQIEQQQLNDERVLGTVQQSDGWRRLVEIIDEDIANYGDITVFKAFTGGGVNELAADVRARAIIVEYLRKLKRRVELAEQSTPGEV